MITDAILPEKFLYSQQSLEAFDKCPMMFRNRYIEKLNWSLNASREQKDALERGKSFHLLAKRYFMGIEPDKESFASADKALPLWLNNLKSAFNPDQGVLYLPEYSIVLRTGKMRLQAILDLVAVTGEGIEIWDWKTHNTAVQADSRTMGKKLEKSLQTKVYLYLLGEYASRSDDNSFRSCFNQYKSIKMHYWQPEPPGIITSISCDDVTREEYGKFIGNKIGQIDNYNWQAFDKRLYSNNCRYCEFNCLCNKSAAEYYEPL